jgi:hypothetical protein
MPPSCVPQVVMTALRGKQAELKIVLDKLAALDADLQEKRKRKERYVSLGTCKLTCKHANHVPSPC